MRLPVKLGREVLAHLRARTRRDPWFAVASSVAHAGQIDYDPQQRLLDRFVRAGPRAVDTPEKAYRAFRLAEDDARIKRWGMTGEPRRKPAQLLLSRAIALSHAAQCYTRVCGQARTQDGKCLTREGREALLGCIRESARKFKCDSPAQQRLAERLLSRSAAGFVLSQSAMKAWREKYARRSQLVLDFQLPIRTRWEIVPETCRPRVQVRQFGWVPDRATGIPVYDRKERRGLPWRWKEQRGVPKVYKARLARKAMQQAFHRAGALGPKAADMLRLYLDDDEAIAVDRHVGAFVCAEGGEACDLYRRTVTKYTAKSPLWSGWREIDYATYRRRYELGLEARRIRVQVPYRLDREKDSPYEVKVQGASGQVERVSDMVKRHVRGVAEKHGVTPAEVSVAAWVGGVCRTSPGGDVYISDELSIKCEPAPLERWGIGVARGQGGGVK